MRAQGRIDRKPEARVTVRTDPLERYDCVVRARWGTCDAGERPVFGPARGQSNSGRDRADRVRLSRICARARATVFAGGDLVGAGDRYKWYRPANSEQR